jgi:solute carrier family 25 protein 38
MSGIFASIFTQPQDVIRSYIQLDPSNYKSTIKTARLIYSKNGLNGFMKGILPRSLRRVLISVMSWTLYEKITLK